MSRCAAALSFLLGFLLFCGSFRTTLAQVAYTVEQITSDTSLRARGVNSAGQVVGEVWMGGNFMAFRYQDGALTSLGRLPGGIRSGAYAINDNGVVAGYSTDSTGNSRAVRFGVTGIADLGTFDGSSAGAYAINGSGHISGYAQLGGTTSERAFLHDGTNLTNLGVLSGGVHSNAWGINDGGIVVGSSNKSVNGEQLTRAFRFQHNNIQELGTLGGPHSSASDINNRGHIVGYAYQGQTLNSVRGFLYRQGLWTSIGILPGHSISEAYAINDADEVIGQSRITGGPRAGVIYRGGRLQDLNSLIPPGTGWTLDTPTAISENGLIVGFGRLNNTNRSFLLRPRYSLTSTPSPTVQPVGPLTVEWTAPPDATPTDWIGLYSVGDPDTAYRWWMYTGGAESGSANITAPRQSGQYEFRYFHNNGYQLLESSAPFTVPYEQITGSLTVSATSVLTKAPLSVSWQVNPGRPDTDWIGLFKVDGSNREYVWWQYTMGAASGTFNLTAPSEAGQYQFRYLLRDGYTHAITSQTVTVNSPSSGYSVNGSPTTASPGGSIIVQWTAPEGSTPSDWIGLYREGEIENRSYLWPHWFYTGGTAAGSQSMTMPASPGRYVLRYLLNNGYAHTAQSAVILVD